MIKTKVQQMSKSGQAALNRMTNSKMNPTTSGSNLAPSSSRSSRECESVLQGHLTEEEALAIALSESAQTNIYNPTEDEDAALARAIQQSELEARNSRNMAGSNKDTCVLS